MQSAQTDPLIGKNINDLVKSGLKVEDFNPIGMNIRDVEAAGHAVSDVSAHPLTPEEARAQGARTLRGMQSQMTAPDSRSWTEVALSGFDTAVRGAKDFTDSIATGQLPKALLDIPANLARGHIQEAARGAQGMTDAVIQPVGTLIRGGIALASPGAAEAPSRSEWEQAQKAAGANLLATAVGAVGELPRLTKSIESGIRFAGKQIATPEGLMLRAANNRSPLPSANLRNLSGDMAVTAGGYGIKGAGGAAIAESANLIRKSSVFRNAKAAIQEAAARFLAENDVMPTFEQATARAVLDSRPLSASGIPPLLDDRIPVLETKPIAARSSPLPYDGPSLADDRIPVLDMKPPAVRTPPIAADILISPELGSVDYSAIERALNPSGSRARQAMLRGGDRVNTAPLARRLVEEIPDLRPGPQFESKLLEGFDRVERGVIDAEDAVPRETKVPREPILDHFRALKSEYEAAGYLKTVNALDKVIGIWSKTPRNMPWEEFIALKRGFFRELPATAAMRRAYGITMETTSRISPELAAANRSYSTVRQALDAAGIHEPTGRRLSEVGKAAKDSIANRIAQSSPQVRAPSLARSVSDKMAQRGLFQRIVNETATQYLDEWADLAQGAREGVRGAAEGSRPGSIIDENVEGKASAEKMQSEAARVGKSYGIKEGSPLAEFAESPKQLIEAARLKRGALYDRMLRAYREWTVKEHEDQIRKFISDEASPKS